MEDTIKMHERVAALEKDEKSIHRRLDNLEKLVESVHTIATETKAMREDMNTMETRMEEVEKRPIKRYDTVVTAILTTVVGIFIGYVLNGGV